MNYENMSDFEINMRVACSIEGVSVDENGKPDFAIDCFLSSDNGISVKWLRCGNDEYEFFNPCNNPSDAWPIIVGKRINVYASEGPDLMPWMAGCAGFVSSHKNPLRAAMIVFLMMQEQWK